MSLKFFIGNQSVAPLKTNQLHLKRWLSIKNLLNRFFYVNIVSYIYLH